MKREPGDDNRDPDDDTTTRDEVAWGDAVRAAICPIDVYVDAYIPDRRVANPLPVTLPPDTTYYHAFAGDNRGPMKGGSARMWQSVIVDICADDPTIHTAHDTGITTGYRYETIKVREVPWYDLFTPAYRIVEVSDTARASTGGLKETIKSLGNCGCQVKMEGSASDPLVTLAPAVDYILRVKLWCVDGEIKYRLTGRHDGYPAFTVFLGATMIYSFNPADHDETPLSMFGSGEHRVEQEGTVSAPEQCACDEDGE